MGRSVIGQRILRFSDATWTSSSDEEAATSVVEEGNQVEA